MMYVMNMYGNEHGEYTARTARCKETSGAWMSHAGRYAFLSRENMVMNSISLLHDPQQFGFLLVLRFKSYCRQQWGYRITQRKCGVRNIVIHGKKRIAR